MVPQAVPIGVGPQQTETVQRSECMDPLGFLYWEPLDEAEDSVGFWKAESPSFSEGKEIVIGQRQPW